MKLKKTYFNIYSLQKTRNRRFENVLICQLIVALFFHNVWLIFASFVHYFLMFFMEPLSGAIFKAKGANRHSKVGFLSHFRRPRGPKIGLPSAIFRQNGSQNRRNRSTGTFLNPFGPRLGTQNAPRTDFPRFPTDFSSILDRFSMDFCHMFNGFGIVFPCC